MQQMSERGSVWVRVSEKDRAGKESAVKRLHSNVHTTVVLVVAKSDDKMKSI